MADATQTSTLKKVLRRLKPHTFAIVLVLLARKIWRTHGTLDVNNLTALKG